MIDIDRPKDFDEKAYLRENPDVAQHVRSHPETNGWEHFARFGYLERNRRGVPPRLFDYVKSYRETTIKPAAPAHLRKRLHGDENLQTLEGTGRMLAANIFGQLMRIGPYGKDFRILDFGVGCGRVAFAASELGHTHTHGHHVIICQMRHLRSYFSRPDRRPRLESRHQATAARSCPHRWTMRTMQPNT
jgi:hypothetical protein